MKTWLNENENNDVNSLDNVEQVSRQLPPWKIAPWLGLGLGLGLRLFYGCGGAIFLGGNCPRIR